MFGRFNLKSNTKFNIETLYHSQFNVTYRGIPAWRCPFDYVNYQMILNEVKPDLVIEIGTNYGGGAYYIADLLSLMGNGVVHTIDIESKIYPEVLEAKNILFFDKGWADYDLSLAKGYNKILVIDDASHTYEDVKGVLNKFWPVVTPESYFIVEDGVIDDLVKMEILPVSKHNGGPVKAIDEFMLHNNNFVVDRKWLDFYGTNATFNYKGYLKRKS